jgi:hypothetical protein
VRRKNVHLWIAAAALAAALAAGSAVAALQPGAQSAAPQSAAQQPPAKQPGASPPSIVIPLRASLSASHVASLQVASTATGRFIGGLIRGGVSAGGQRPNLSWSLFWAVGVTNTTGPVTGVEIRSGEASAAATGSLFLTLCSPCNNVSASAAGGVGATTLRGGTIRNLTQEQVNALRRSDLFVNVTTAANPAGELRGQITRRSPVTSSAPPNNRIPNPLKPGAPQKVPSP